MKRGSEVTAAGLLSRIQALYRKINGLVASNFKSLSTGQLSLNGEIVRSDDSNDIGKELIGEVFSVSCEQYFAKKEFPVYTSKDTMFCGEHGGEKPLAKLQEEIDKVRRL